jgi:hypothetical protein
VRRAANDSLAPLAAHSFARALPIPEEAPVITTTLFFTGCKIGFFIDAKLIENLYKMNGNADLADKEGLKGVKWLKMLKELRMLNVEGLEQQIVPACQARNRKEGRNRIIANPSIFKHFFI